MAGLSFSYKKAEGFFAEEDLRDMLIKAEDAQKKLMDGSGPGSFFTGWLNLPLSLNKEELERIKAVASRIREIADVLVVIGIGGSYLGARSALESLNHFFHNSLDGEKRKNPAVFFAGNNISSSYLAQLIDMIKDKSIVLNVVSKSGATLEPAIAFRVLRGLIEKKYGREKLKERIIFTTDSEKGILKEIAAKEGCESFVIPDNVGGRYSVLTAVGLLPMAAGGINIDEVIAGALEGMRLCSEGDPLNNPAMQYAAIRNVLYKTGKKTEILVSYEPSFYYIAEWWKQLFGESEGKEGKGIFPANLNFTADLHSMGQYLQEGRRDLFLTTLWARKPVEEMIIPEADSYVDGLDYLSGKSLHYVNEKACEATIDAHVSGGVPNLLIEIPRMTPFHYGQLIYFFEKTCALSGYLLAVNPFDQPGVEAYKKNMYSLLGK